MKNNKKIIIMIIIVVIVAITGVVTYTSHKKNKVIAEFNNYIEEYKDDISTYIIDKNETKYQDLINKCEQIIANKEFKKVEGLKEELSQFKDDLTNINIELINKSISELEAIDISKLDDKDSIVNKIGSIKKLRHEKEFVNANEEVIALTAEINKKLEIKKQEEEKAEAEAKAKAEAAKAKAQEEAKAKAEEEMRVKAQAEAEAKVQSETKADVQEEVDNQGGTQSTNGTEIIIQLPTVDFTDIYWEEHYGHRRP
ncbi:hypothetical protein GCM10008908_02640 [Clostridium subterminale]|uniref:Lipoprotein n=1 Tax=Clostridium subterminale TaxID=1550 RepID=A0ABN1KG41_CLOSU